MTPSELARFAAHRATVVQAAAAVPLALEDQRAPVGLAELVASAAHSPCLINFATLAQRWTQSRTQPQRAILSPTAAMVHARPRFLPLRALNATHSAQV